MTHLCARLTDLATFERGGRGPLLRECLGLTQRGLSTGMAQHVDGAFVPMTWSNAVISSSV